PVKKDFGEAAAVVVPRAEEQNSPNGLVPHGASGPIGSALPVGRKTPCPSYEEARRLMRPCRFGHALYRSISPMTMSMLPTIAGMSAIRQPRQRALVTLRLLKLDDR